MGSENLAFLYSLPQEKASTPVLQSSESEAEESYSSDSSSEEEREDLLLPGPVKKRKKKYQAKTEDGVTEDSTKRVFVGKLPKHYTEQQIRDHFTPFGAVVSVTNSWGYVPENGKYKGVAIVTFAEADSARDACAAAISIENCILIVRPHTKVVKKPKHAVGSRTLFVGNLPFGITKQALAELFSPCGTILSVRLPANVETKKPLGFGFVVFQGLVHMKLAMKLNGHLLAGRAITVGEQKKVAREDKKGDALEGGPSIGSKSGSKDKGTTNAAASEKGKDTKRRKGLTGGGSDQAQTQPRTAPKPKAAPAPAPVASVASAFCGKRVKLG